MHEILREIPSEIADVLKRQLKGHDDAFHYMVATIDRMRYRKRLGMFVSTVLLREMFPASQEKRIRQTFKLLVEKGLLWRDDSYCPSRGNLRGRPKSYGIMDVLMLPESVSNVDQHIDGHRVGPSSSVGPPPRRAVSPRYFSVSASVAEAERQRFASACHRLGWDCVGLDVSGLLSPVLAVVDCPWSQADILAYFHREKKTRKRRKARDLSDFDPAVAADCVVKSLEALGRVEQVAFRRNGRCYHLLTNVPVEMRRSFRFRCSDGGSERAVEVDVSSMHWAILTAMMPSSPEKASLVAALERGQFYDLLRDRLLSAGTNLYPQEEFAPVGEAFKLVANQFILFRDRSLGDRRRIGFWIGLKTMLPGLAKVFMGLERYYSLRHRSFILTRIEGKITLDRVLVQLLEAGVPALPMHDGVIVPESQQNLAISLYERALQEVLGFVPRVRPKTPPLSSDDLERMSFDETIDFDPVAEFAEY